MWNISKWKRVIAIILAVLIVFNVPVNVDAKSQEEIRNYTVEIGNEFEEIEDEEIGTLTVGEIVCIIVLAILILAFIGMVLEMTSEPGEKQF